MQVCRNGGILMRSCSCLAAASSLEAFSNQDGILNIDPVHGR